MPLVECKDCGKNVSKLAKSCPNCGSPIRQAWRSYLLIASAIVGAVGGYMIGHLLVDWWLGLILAYFGQMLLPIGFGKIIGDHPYNNSKINK